MDSHDRTKQETSVNILGGVIKWIAMIRTEQERSVNILGGVIKWIAMIWTELEISLIS